MNTYMLHLFPRQLPGSNEISTLKPLRRSRSTTSNSYILSSSNSQYRTHIGSPIVQSVRSSCQILSGFSTKECCAIKHNRNICIGIYDYFYHWKPYDCFRAWLYYSFILSMLHLSPEKIVSQQHSYLLGWTITTV